MNPGLEFLKNTIAETVTKEENLKREIVKDEQRLVLMNEKYEELRSLSNSLSEILETYANNKR
jgi:hypothetical protein